MHQWILGQADVQGTRTTGSNFWIRIVTHKDILSRNPGQIQKIEILDEHSVPSEFVTKGTKMVYSEKLGKVFVP